MGTNYYLVNKKEYEDEKIFKQIINEQVDKIGENGDNQLQELIKEVILKQYGPITDQLKEKKYDEILERFESNLDEAVSKLVTDLRYDVNYTLYITDRTQKHIGKSSMGWLFNFQYQDEWHSYDEFKAYVTNQEKMKDQIIIDEYGEEISAEDLIKKIDDKQSDKRNLDNPDNFRYCDNVDGYRFSNGDFS